MPRGGHREKAGRPSTWKSGCKFSETKLIRVPAAISDQVLEFAHKLDSGESLDLETKQLSLPISQSLVVDSNTCLSGVELGRRLNVSSAAFNPYVKKGYEALAEYTRSKDPEGIAWVRDGKKYRPVLPTSSSAIHPA
jgi:hypothetical protein